jgi:Domain of unknown function (DUF4331)
MKTNLFVAMTLTLAAGAALASSHREAPAIANDPAADNTDVYAFMSTGSATNDTLNIVANWIPFEEPSSGPNFFKFSDDVQYQIHIARGPTSLADVVTYTLKFTTQADKPVDITTLSTPCASPGTLACIGGGKEFFAQLTGNIPTTGGAIIQTYTLTKTTSSGSTVIVTSGIVAPWNIGPRTQATLHSVAPGLVSSANYNDPAFLAGFNFTASDGTKVFAGPRDDGFYVDLGGVFDLANLRPKGTAQDGLAGYNVHSIALAIPVGVVSKDGTVPTVTNGGTPDDQNTIGVWASASRRKVSILRADGHVSSYGPFIQVSRLGLPLINEAVIGHQDKDRYNRTQPKDDVANFGAYFLNPVIVPDAEVVGIYGSLPASIDPSKLRHNRTDILQVIGLAASGCTTFPTTPCHNLTAIGDVLRVDLGLDPAAAGNGFPNGRSLNTTGNAELADVTDVELTLLIAGVPGLSMNGGNGGPPLIQDGVDHNDVNFPGAFPWLAVPHEGFSGGHGKVPQ